jgi:hypothetical protein
MTAFRDSLPDDATRDRFDVAMDGGGKVLASARRTRDELYAREGALGVARAAFVPGGKSVEELAEGYEALAEQARQSRTAA